MEAFKNAVTIRRTPEEVFTFLADFQNVPKWNYAIESTTKVSPGPVGMGTVYHQIRSIPRRAEEGFEVTVFEPGRRIAIEGTIGPFHARELSARVDRQRDKAHQRRRTRAVVYPHADAGSTRCLSGQGCCRREPRGVEADP